MYFQVTQRGKTPCSQPRSGEGGVPLAGVAPEGALPSPQRGTESPDVRTKAAHACVCTKICRLCVTSVCMLSVRLRYVE